VIQADIEAYRTAAPEVEEACEGPRVSGACALAGAGDGQALASPAGWPSPLHPVPPLFMARPVTTIRVFRPQTCP
jgi:hypothetical protein